MEHKNILLEEENQRVKGEMKAEKALGRKIQAEAEKSEKSLQVQLRKANKEADELRHQLSTQFGIDSGALKAKTSPNNDSRRSPRVISKGGKGDKGDKPKGPPARPQTGSHSAHSELSRLRESCLAYEEEKKGLKRKIELQEAELVGWRGGSICGDSVEVRVSPDTRGTVATTPKAPESVEEAEERVNDSHKTPVTTDSRDASVSFTPRQSTGTDCVKLQRPVEIIEAGEQPGGGVPPMPSSKDTTCTRTMMAQRCTLKKTKLVEEKGSCKVCSIM